MWQNFGVKDQVLRQSMFMADEVQYNLIHRICESERSICLKASNETMVFAQSEGHNAWLWVSKELAAEPKKKLLQELLEILKGNELPGISGDRTTVEHFAKVYSEANGLEFVPYMIMESYVCSQVRKPVHVEGILHLATRQHLEKVAEFLAGFSEGAYGVKVEPSSQISAAESVIETGNLYLWLVDGHPVSMANIAHRSPRHARINAVYTPSAFRKNGYASAVVAELSSILISESLEPMLYADLKNPDANKVYQNIGFVERGQVADIKFK
ncbi:GNAT family N-acetyltransferase [Paenibacillus taichungensis]|uniref:GNAT family N-acetyltransferase n=1 Tax=Paenibacillus taichungensis TaxID=484184 RepID=UPI0038CFCC2D